jgi:hypothetical protein
MTPIKGDPLHRPGRYELGHRRRRDTHMPAHVNEADAPLGDKPPRKSHKPDPSGSPR